MNVIMPLADGFEETEAVTVIDILRRAGIGVTTAALQSSIVESARKIRMMADAKLESVNEKEYDAIVLPGGSLGVENLRKSKRIMKIVQEFHKEGKLVAAICAAPSILAEAGILENVRATIYPGMERSLPKPRGDSVVIDGNVITSQGPGTAMEFSLRLVERLAGREAMNAIREQVVYKG